MAEVRYLHRYAIFEEWWAWVPIVYGFVAALLCLAAMARAEWLRRVALVWLVAGAVFVGPMGFWKHSHEKPARAFERMAERIERANRKEDDPRPEGPPLLAPLSLSGLALIGAISLWPPRRGRSE